MSDQKQTNSINEVKAGEIGVFQTMKCYARSQRRNWCGSKNYWAFG